MEFKKYEKQAADGKPMPNDLGLVDACMYEALRYLYASHRLTSGKNTCGRSSGQRLRPTKKIRPKKTPTHYLRHFGSENPGRGKMKIANRNLGLEV